MTPYQLCGHCGCEFLPTGKQARRARTSATGKSYCSAICCGAAHGAALRGRRRSPRYMGTCLTCAKPFESRYDGRKYCSMKCYTISPEFRQRIRALAPIANAAMVLKMTGAELRPKVEISCINCGTKMILKASEGQRKYCNKRCYRQYMAGRFDRWIASPQSMALPHSYDEFLSQNELPCLVEGCEWLGQNLGNHVNFAHGITAQEFKRAVGFNLKTGLVTPAVSETLSDRQHIHAATFGFQPGDPRPMPPLIRGYQSLEGSEHRAKSMALKLASPSEIPPRTCRNCGAEYQPGPIAYGKKFCTIQCRNAYYETNRLATKFWLPCGECRKDFEGLIEQKRRWERGRAVFCSVQCRQMHNGRAAGAAHHQRYLDRQVPRGTPPAV